MRPAVSGLRIPAEGTLFAGDRIGRRFQVAVTGFSMCSSNESTAHKRLQMTAWLLWVFDAYSAALTGELLFLKRPYDAHS